MSDPAGPRDVRLAELVAVLSFGTDLGLGQPMEHIIRQTLICLRLADQLALDETDRRVLYYAGLLAWVGCHVDAYEQAKWLGDDIAAKRDARYVDLNSTRAEIAWVLTNVGAGRTTRERVKVGIGFLAGGYRDLEQMLGNHCIATEALAASLGLDEPVQVCLRQAFERWDGRGPQGLKGTEILLCSRMIAFADVIEVHHRGRGSDAAVAVARERRGTEFDPGLVDLFCSDPDTVLGELEAVGTWERVLESEPTLERTLDQEELDAALAAIADFADLKSPYTLGHSRGVSDLAAAAAERLSLPAADVTTIRRAALIHDLGRLGVSNAIWDKRGPLTAAERERVRLHPYLTERMLTLSPALAPLAAVAVHHHERLDGSGYPRALRGDALGLSARLLAAADMYRAKTEPRPHRPAGSPDDAASLLREEVKAGRLDGTAVDAVLGAAGHRVLKRRAHPAGLTAREVEVLRLVARGLSNKQIAEQLVISRKTAGNHVEHIYTKVGASNRAQASMFAVKHDLIDANDTR